MDARDAALWGRVKPPSGTPIDRSHPFGRYLDGAFLLNDGGLRAYDAAHPIGGGPYVAGGAGSGPIYDGKFGKCHSFAGDGAIHPVSFPTLINGTKSWSIVCWLYNGGSYGGYVTIIANDAANIGLYITTGGHITFIDGSEYPGTLAMPTNAWSHLVTTYDGVNVRYYMNGIVDPTVTALTADSDTMTWIADDAYADRLSDRMDHLLLFSGYALTLQDVLSLYQSPFQVFEAPTWQVYKAGTAVAPSIYPPFPQRIIRLPQEVIRR